MSGFTVAIVGRPNVGKSTFFNRMLEQRKAIVDDESGVTRDRQYGVADWAGKTFNLIDTGGFVPESEDVFEREIKKQVLIALEEANALIFMVDSATGITSLDEAMADVLRRTTKHVFLAVNKVDNSDRLLEAAEFYSLGFEEIFFLSSMTGSGTGELLDALTALIKEDQSPTEDDGLPKFAIIGQPNVGKSSLLNALIGRSGPSSAISPGQPGTRSIPAIPFSRKTSFSSIRPASAARPKYTRISNSIRSSGPSRRWTRQMSAC